MVNRDRTIIREKHPFLQVGGIGIGAGMVGAQEIPVAIGLLTGAAAMTESFGGRTSALSTA